MTENSSPASPPGGDRPPAGGQPAQGQPDQDVALRPDTGVVAGDDGSVVPLVDGLPAATGSTAWDNPTGSEEHADAGTDHAEDDGRR